MCHAAKFYWLFNCIKLADIKKYILCLLFNTSMSKLLKILIWLAFYLIIKGYSNSISQFGF